MKMRETSRGQDKKLDDNNNLKKSPKAYAEVEELFYTKCKENNVNPNTAKYIWEVQVSRQKGYSFSILHCLVYSLIALQELALYTQYPSIYWNTAVLTVNAGAMEDSDEGDKKQSTSYGKIAKAIGEIQKKGVTVALPDVNQAEYGFVPNEGENAIIFALKGMSKISDDEAFAIVKNRPYKSMKDFYERMVLTKIEVKDKKGGITNQSIVKPSAMINLIKGGAFDKIENKPRMKIMEEYLKLVQPPREKLDTRATQTIVEMGIVPSGTEEYQKFLHFAIRIINLKNYVVHKGNYIGKDEEKKTKKWYVLRGTDKASTDYTVRFFEKYFLPYMTEGKNYDYYYNDEGQIIFSAGLKSTGFMTMYEEYIKDFKEWINSEDCLNKYNHFKFIELWDKEANGNISKWEMDSLNYYYHEHEMANIDREKYLVEDFSSLPEEPIIKTYGQYGKRKYPIYKLNRIAGTVIDKVAKDKMVYVLTTDGEVVGVKFYSGQFSFYDKNISEEKSDGSGKKTVIEESWFKRGNKLLITGYRRENQFIPKKYSGSAYQHTVTLVNEVRGKDLVLQFDRARV